MYPTDLTVSAIVEQGGRYLFVEEYSSGRRVINQPGGHIESSESPEAAVVRETLEETGCIIECGELVGVYLWIHPQTRQQFLRIAFGGSFLDCDETRALDTGICSRHWLTVADLEARRGQLRSPVVLRSLRDFIAGKRQADNLLSGMLPLEHNVDRIIATADLV